MTVPGLIRANGPTVELSPMVAPKIMVFGFIFTFFPILHRFNRQLYPIELFSPIETSSSNTQFISISTFLLTVNFPLMSVLDGSLIKVPFSRSCSALCLKYCCSRFTKSTFEFTPLTSSSLLNLKVVTFLS